MTTNNDLVNINNEKIRLFTELKLLSNMLWATDSRSRSNI